MAAMCTNSTWLICILFMCVAVMKKSAMEGMVDITIIFFLAVVKNIASALSVL